MKFAKFNFDSSNNCGLCEAKAHENQSLKFNYNSSGQEMDRTYFCN